MKKIITFIFSILPLSVFGQAWVYSKEFGTDIWTQPTDKDIEIIDCNNGRRDMLSAGICMRQDGANYMENPTFVKGYAYNTNGLSGNVARAVNAQRPKRTGSSSRFTASSMSEPRRTGKNYNHSTSAQGIAWRKQKAAERQEAIERAQERKREEERRRRIEDDNRAAAVTAATNARLQAETNRRIENDYYHATEGARQAQQRARQTHTMAGPQFNRNRTSNAQQAKMLRGQNKPRRVMYPQRTPQNKYRKQLAQVQRKQVAPEQEILLRKTVALRTKQRQQKNSAKNPYSYKGITVTNNTLSTLGKNWRSDDLKTIPLAPPPTTRTRPTYKEPEWLTEHKMKITEFLGLPPLTQEEELQLLKEHELLSAL